MVIYKQLMGIIYYMAPIRSLFKSICVSDVKRTLKCVSFKIYLENSYFWSKIHISISYYVIFTLLYWYELF